MDDVSMATIKEGMISIGLAKQFDIWSSPSSKLLDYDLTLLESRLATKHQFCLPDETPLHDTTAFEDYVNLLDETCPYENIVPSIKLRFKDTSSSLIDEDKSKLALAASGGNQQAQKAENSNISPSSLDEIQWRRVIKNCQVMHGWYIDRANNEAKMAPKPAFRLRPGLNLELDSTEGAAAGDAIPNYGVTDGTQIDVVTAETDIRNSLVRNNFEKSSIDSKMAIGYAGVGVSVAATSSTESQSAQSAKNKSSTKENIGKYKLTTSKIPRVTLFLNADDLVPTREFIENIEKIKKQADVTDIRKFHERFGVL
ncbi:hypothetical protein SGCOL_005102 [Colletotrichum sp. CLE4]